MLLSVAGLKVDIEPVYELLASRAAAYTIADSTPDVTIRLSDAFLREKQVLLPHLSAAECEYIYTGDLFYRELILRDGFLLHASAVALDGNAYLFSAPSGTGKSTHTHLWLREFGERALIINDDKPAIRLIGERFYACGTPWSGKTDESQNVRFPLTAIAYIVRSPDNSIDKLSTVKALKYILDQTLRPSGRAQMERLLKNLDKLLSSIGVYELRCDISHDAVMTAYKQMSGVAQSLPDAEESP